MAAKFGWKVGDRIPIQATIWQKEDGRRTWEFDLVGIYDGAEEGTDVTNFFFRYDYFDEARLFGAGMVGWYYVRVEDPARAGVVAREIDDEFANSDRETKAETEGAFLRGWARQVGDITTIMVAILSAVFFTILLVAGNTMARNYQVFNANQTKDVHEAGDELRAFRASMSMPAALTSTTSPSPTSAAPWLKAQMPSSSTRSRTAVRRRASTRPRSRIITGSTASLTLTVVAAAITSPSSPLTAMAAVRSALR